jgi:hypothetical protein
MVLLSCGFQINSSGAPSFIEIVVVRKEVSWEMYA